MQTINYNFNLSLALKLAGKSYSKIELERAYGSYYSDDPLGYNLNITIGVKVGSTDQLKEVAKWVHNQFDHEYLNELKIFSEQVPTFENIGLQIYSLLKNRLKENLILVEANAKDEFKVIVKSSEQVTVTRFYKINCVHRHHNPQLTMVENKKLYGKCSGIHGHEYLIELSLTSALNSYDQVYPWDDMDQLVIKNLVNKYDKTYLNDEMGNTSGELISELFYKELKPHIPAHCQFNLTLRETKKNSFHKESVTG